MFEHNQNSDQTYTVILDSRDALRRMRTAAVTDMISAQEMQSKSMQLMTLTAKVLLDSTNQNYYIKQIEKLL